MSNKLESSDSKYREKPKSSLLILIGVITSGALIFSYFESSFLNTYLDHVLGLEYWTISLMVTLSAIMGLTFMLIWGIKCDNTRTRFGRRRPFLLFGLIAGSAMIIYAFSPNYIFCLLLDVVIIGAESGSDLELEYYNKRANAQDNYNMTKLLIDMDIFYVFVGFIMFGPNTTLDILKENIKYLQTFNVDYNLGFISNTMMLIKDSKLYYNLKLENRVIEATVPGELPKYRFLDPKTEKVAKVWQNLFNEFPVTQKVSNVQINSGNLVSRMLNPMNEKIFDVMKEEYYKFKDTYKALNKEFGCLQSQFFLDIIELVENNVEEILLENKRKEFFNNTYSKYLPKYEKNYYGFIEQIQNKGFSLSGIIFENFMSALLVSKAEKFEDNEEG